jgi:predicted nucleotidyltransferase
MLPLIEQHRTEIAALCRRFGVKRLDVFGSAARGADFDPARSDVDLLVEFEQMSPGAYADAYFGLKEALEEVFGRGVDLVSDAAVRNPFFRRGIERNKTLLYAA